jgi:phage shock protein PspC (stress-responsive transcriptional regulator)
MSEHISPTPMIRRLERPENGRVLAGVCAGLGHYFELNPAFFRLGFVVLTLLGGTGVLVYLAALLVIPSEDKEQSIVEQVVAERREHPGPLVALAVVAFAVIALLCNVTVWPAVGGGWVLLLAAGLAVLWASRGQHRASRLLRLLLGLAALTVAVVAAAIAVAFSWFDVSFDNGVGNRTYAPATPTALQSSYHLGVGRMRLDLSALPAGTNRHVDARVDVGHLIVVLPRDAGVTVHAHAKAGDLNVLGEHTDGRNVDLTVGGGRLTVDAHVGAGDVEVERAQ